MHRFNRIFNRTLNRNSFSRCKQSWNFRLRPSVKHLIILTETISLGVLLVLTGCAPKTNMASAPNQTPESPAPAQTSPTPATATPGVNDSPADMTLDSVSTRILDNDLVIKAAQDNLFGIQAGQVAARKATNAAVKQFGEQMVRDHTQAADALSQMAAKRNLTLPREMGEQNQAVLARLTEQSGDAFDRAYMTEIVNFYQQLVLLARNEAQNGKDPELKALAAEKLPALENYLQRAQTLAQQLSG